MRYLGDHGRVEHTTPRDTDHYYYVFDTLDAAQRWASQFQRTLHKQDAMNNPGYQRRISAANECDVYKQIYDLLHPPRDEIGRTIDNVVPPVPTGTLPQ